MRGTHVFALPRVHVSGSSPHMRGTRHDHRHTPHLSGIIPAYAGNTLLFYPASGLQWDHPRICGEHASNVSDSSRNLGSSPHMRGTRQIHRGRVTQVGIIPAYAGNTCVAIDGEFYVRDHPRICGEHWSIAWAISLMPGSSPHMRGTRVLSVVERTPIGIIPAYAGNTCLGRQPLTRLEDHPRICGEHHGAAFDLNVNTGSSPHMRGTPHPRRNTPRRRGIIPAYAGNTHVQSALITRLGDHPRICGEHVVVVIFHTPSGGSSPHMRGTHTHGVAEKSKTGIIPAYAGNT